jgi:hypothetical protein
MLSINIIERLNDEEIENLATELKKKKTQSIQYLLDKLIFFPLKLVWVVIILVSAYKLVANTLLAFYPECRNILLLNIL